MPSAGMIASAPTLTEHADKFMELQESLVSTSAPHNIPDRYRISVVLPERHSQHS